MTVPVDLNSISTPITGGVAPAAWGGGVRDRFEWQTRNKPTCKATRTTNFTHNASGTFLDVPFNLEKWDVGGCHSTATLAERVVAPDAGLYSMMGSLAWTGNVTGRRVLAISKNGTTELVQAEMGISGGESSGFVACMAHLDAGDYITLRAFQDSGGNLDVLGFDEWTPWLSFMWLHDA